MSRLFPERYSAAAGTDQLAIRVRPGLRRKEKKSPVALIELPADGAETWHKPLGALRSYFSGLDRANRELDLILSDRFFQFVLVPWSDQVLHPAERETLARIQLENMHGAAVGAKVKIDDAGYGKPAIACALDEAFLEALQTLEKEHGVRLCSLTPHFMLAFNRWRKHLKDECIFVSAERHHCVMLHIRNDMPIQLRTFHASPSGIVKLLEREMILLDVAEQATVYFAGVKVDGTLLPKHWNTVQLEPHDTSSVSDVLAMLDLEDA